MDILMGRFVDARVEALTAAALAELEALLDLPDDAVYRWLSGAEQPPAERDTPLLQQIIDFHRHDGPIH